MTGEAAPEARLVGFNGTARCPSAITRRVDLNLAVWID